MNKTVNNVDSGFTLLEITISVSVLSIALFALLSTITRSSSLQQEMYEQSQAVSAARSILEQMKRNGTFSEIFKRYNGTTLDDFGLTGSIPGSNFSVTGLVPLRSDLDQQVGLITFPTDPQNPSVLLENSAVAKRWSPNGLDLNLDGIIDGVDHSTNYQLLPLIITIEWLGTGGSKKVEIPTIVYPQGAK